MHPNNGHKPQIPQEQIDTIKQGVDLVPLMQSCGLELKQVGSNYQGFCPFHEDSSSPSLTVNPEENLWNCFGCEAGGDNIRFVQLFDKISFNKAVDRLKGFTGKPKKAKSPAPKTELAVKEKKLLARVVDLVFIADVAAIEIDHPSFLVIEREDHRVIKDLVALLIEDAQFLQGLGYIFILGQDITQGTGDQASTEVLDGLVVSDASFLEVIKATAIFAKGMLVIVDHPGQQLFFFNR